MLRPEIGDGAASFALRDRRYRRVALRHELRQPRIVPFARVGRDWQLRLERPPVDRLEYLLEIEHRDGRVEWIPDPANPQRTPGPFGDKSVVEFPGYEPPAWVGDEESPAGDLVDGLWSAADTDPDEPLPLVLVHDGPEYAEYAQLLQLFAHLVAFGDVPPFRAALLPPPGDRNESYSASARYARSLERSTFPPATRTIGIGASLGAVAFLHAHFAVAGILDGLLLQSGSFFRRRFDAHESRFSRYARVTRFVSRVSGGREPAERIPVRMTCGTGEENLDNNRFLAETLAFQGWDVRLHEHRDAHNWISWRDSIRPSFVELLT